MVFKVVRLKKGRVLSRYAKLGALRDEELYSYV